jgi:cytoskeletal protein CcmA (bactofilin family)
MKKYIKMITLTISLVILSALAFVGVANAQSFKSGDTVTVATNETISGMLFASGNSIDIAGTINGDLYCAGATVTISGTVNGDVLCAGQTIVISGKIDGDARLAASTVTLSSDITGSATVGAQTLVIDNDAKINRDLLGGVNSLTLNGEIGRDMLAGGTDVIVNGKIGRNLKGGVENITIGSSGVIGGNVEYVGTKDPVISSGGRIDGTITRTEPKSESASATFSPVAFTFGFFIYGLIAMLLVALILVGLFPRVFNEASEITMKKPGITFLTGLVAAVVIPISIGILLVSFVGIPLAILALLVWFIVIILSGPFSAYLLGKYLLPKSSQPIGIMALGGAVLFVSYFIPIIGFFTMIGAYLFGTGMILSRSRWMTLRDNKAKVTKK